MLKSLCLLKIYALQILTREKKKIRLAEQRIQQIAIPSQNSSNSLPRQQQQQQPQQTITAQPPANNNNNNGNSNSAKDSGYGKDIKGE